MLLERPRVWSYALAALAAAAVMLALRAPSTHAAHHDSLAFHRVYVVPSYR